MTWAPAAFEEEVDWESEVEVEVPVACPSEFVKVFTTVLFEAPGVELAITLPLVTDPDADPEVIVLNVDIALPASLVTCEYALPPAPLMFEAAALPAVLASEAIRPAPLAAVVAAPSAPFTAVEATPSAPVMALLTPLATLLSWARTAVEERRRMEASDLRCIVYWFASLFVYRTEVWSSIEW